MARREMDMAMDIKYRVVEKYAVTAELNQPMHIGSAGGDKGEILVHPVDDVPFIQASGIAGVLRSYCESYCPQGTAEKFFGKIRKKEDDSEKEESEEGGQSDKKESEKDSDPDDTSEESFGSRFRISDGYFLNTKDKVGLELRPRIAINPKTGSVASSEVKGSGIISGHKFEMEYIGQGAKCRFLIYDMSPDASVDGDGESEGKKLLERLFTAINTEDIQFGGQKSNGCGYMKIDTVEFRRFDLTDEDQLREWIKDDPKQMQLWLRGDESPLPGMQTIEFIAADSTGSGIDHDESARPGVQAIKYNAADSIATAYRITVTGKTENRLLVKAIAVANKDGSAPDARNITDRAGDYIIPASSLKGVLRARTAKILRLLRKYRKGDIFNIMRDSFGSDIARDEKTSGNLRFFDTVVKDVWSGSTNPIAERASSNHKIHIDKFTGGVMNKALVTENAVGGEMTFRINILDMNSPDKTCAVMLMALRDLANGQFNLGSGWASGMGFIDVEKIEVESSAGKAILDFKNCTISDEKELIKKCMDTLDKKEAV